MRPHAAPEGFGSPHRSFGHDDVVVADQRVDVEDVRGQTVHFREISDTQHQVRVRSCRYNEAAPVNAKRPQDAFDARGFRRELDTVIEHQQAAFGSALGKQ